MHDPTDPAGRLLFNVLAMVDEFESDLIRMRTREGLAVAKAKGRLRGRKPKLTPRQEAHLVDVHRGGDTSTTELPSCSAGAGLRSTWQCSVQTQTVHLSPQPAGEGRRRGHHQQ